jgi:outer membrane protein TolC
MGNDNPAPRCVPPGLAAGLLLVVALAPEALAVDAPSPAAAPEQSPALTLAECIAIGRQNQPTLAAHRASLAAAETSKRSMERSRVPRCLAPDLPARRLQTAEGVVVSAAGLELAEIDMVHDVTRTYFLVLYARAQRAAMSDLVSALQGDLEVATAIVKRGPTREDIQERHVLKISVYRREAEIRGLEAERGEQQALAALREAMGVAPDCCLKLADQDLPEPPVDLCRDHVLAAAVAQRPEVRAAAAAVTITRLEIDAQAALHWPLARTCALLSDIHAETLPELGTPEYKPSMVGYEMPPKLAGSRCTRTERARDFSARAEAVSDKTRALVVLDADATFARWLSARRALPPAKAAMEEAARVAPAARFAFNELKTKDTDKLLADEVLAAQARVKYNEERFEYAAGLADLERVTAGALCLGPLIGQSPVGGTP